METSLPPWLRWVGLCNFVFLQASRYFPFTPSVKCIIWSLNSTSSTPRRTGMAGKMTAAPVLSKKGISGWQKLEASFEMWTECMTVFLLFPLKQVSWWQTQKAHQEKTSSRRLPRKRTRPQDFHGKVCGKMNAELGFKSIFFPPKNRIIWSRFEFFCLFFFVSDELTRLWNLNHDNMEACKSDSRSVDHWNFVK